MQDVITLNRWMEVKSIHGDEDTRPIPLLIRERFLAIASDVPNESSIQVVVGDGYAELSLRCQSTVPDSVVHLQNAVRAVADPEISINVNRESQEEFVLFIKREKLSR